ncbi:hypothetical protein EW146_g3544 [Bondarzewia mesenterica]|uniref:Uncharacterized protein n=1 Tax=Bondarzewia mesenterica TaxID=1095465 RepID=A0A4S4LX78_9AGAM|nr:hypothetical protein EW146_g3544 [Bondarzewia mesenterica]
MSKNNGPESDAGPSTSENASEDRESLYYSLKGKDVRHLYKDAPGGLVLSDEVEERLSLLVRIAEALGVDDMSFSSYSAAIARLSAETLSVKQENLHMRRAENELEVHLTSVKHEHRLIVKPSCFIIVFSLIHTDTCAGDPCLVITTQKEMPEEPSVTIGEFLKQRERIRDREKALRTKRAKVEIFKGLPPNLALAQQELRGARKDLVMLTDLRERLLERMAEGVS